LTRFGHSPSQKRLNFWIAANNAIKRHDVGVGDSVRYHSEVAEDKLDRSFPELRSEGISSNLKAGWRSVHHRKACQVGVDELKANDANAAAHVQNPQPLKGTTTKLFQQEPRGNVCTATSISFQVAVRDFAIKLLLRGAIP
jgi:hypothetical protein